MGVLGGDGDARGVDHVKPAADPVVRLITTDHYDVAPPNMLAQAANRSSTNIFVRIMNAYGVLVVKYTMQAIIPDSASSLNVLYLS